VTAGFAQRAILLAGVTLLGAVVALGLAARLDVASGSSDLPEAVPAPGGGWYHALAAIESPRAYGRANPCGPPLERDTLGVSHPVLVCGAKIYVGHGDTEILTQVVARGPASAAVQFGLTDAVARELGIRGRTMIRWRFARARE
jgi:hypothetical protein